MCPLDNQAAAPSGRWLCGHAQGERRAALGLLSEQSLGGDHEVAEPTGGVRFVCEEGLAAKSERDLKAVPRVSQPARLPEAQGVVKAFDRAVQPAATEVDVGDLERRFETLAQAVPHHDRGASHFSVEEELVAPRPRREHGVQLLPSQWAPA